LRFMLLCIMIGGSYDKQRLWTLQAKELA
jgi:hypothetical protein